MCNKNYLHAYLRVHGRPESRAVRERGERSAPSLHGLLIPNFTDNGRGASSFFFTPIHLLNAERALGFGGQSGWILRARRDLTRFFFSSSPRFSFLFFFTPVLLFRSPHRGENMVLVPHSHRKPSTTAEGLILWRVWGKADINVAGTRIEPRDRGEPQPVKNTLDLSSRVVPTDSVAAFIS